MTYFVTYDISDTESRCKIAKALENVGIRVQYSFFYCELEPEHMELLFKRLSAYIDTQYDSLHVYPVCKDCLYERKILGSSSFTPEAPYLML